MTRRRQTLTEAIDLARTPGSALSRALDFAGKTPCEPTACQAMAQLHDALPHRRLRSYTTRELLEALYDVDVHGRYVRRQPDR